MHQGGVKPTVSGVIEELKFKISEGYDQNWCFPDLAQLAVSAAETASWAESGYHQFWSKHSEILNLRSPTIPETVVFMLKCGNLKSTQNHKLGIL